MNIPHSSTNISKDVEPALYLLEMDSSINLRTSDTQGFPLHILSNGVDLSHASFFLPIQNKEGVSQELHSLQEVLIDPDQDAAVSFINVQVEDYQPGQKQLSSCQSLHQTPSLYNVNFQQISESQDKIGTSEANLISLPTNSSEQAMDITYKKRIQNYVHISDRSIPPRAVAVLPTILQIRRKDMISPRRTLLPHTRFGPIQGIKQTISIEDCKELSQSAAMNKTPLFVLREEDYVVCIDVSDKDKANWIGLLPLGDETSANVWIYEENRELYIITSDKVPSRKQLMLGYSKKYALDHGLVGPTKDIETGLTMNSEKFWCSECQQTMSSASHLQRHMSTYHQDGKAHTRRRRYRCRHCTQTFSRIFTLRRHVARHCEKKPTKSDNVISAETLPDAILNTSLNSDDNRIPSDESFHNYSNGLDFSTNLFDTDRMPSLDISGNSRSEVFNPYGLVSISNDVEYANGSPNKVDGSASKRNENIQQEKTSERSKISCNYCKEEITKGSRRQHISECPARQFECHCKKLFASQELLALHIYSEHPADKEAEQEKQNDDSNTTGVTVENNKTYVCEQCQHAFKRRGMLVNHLWRVHKMASARVPLVRRVRHFPCGSCPKLYRTAAKRARHVRTHHPGAENVRAKEIEGGTRLCTPAACSECPREYATRSKLLQHQRQHHPSLVPTPPKGSHLNDKSDKTSERAATSEELLKYKTSLQQLLNFY